MKGPRAGTLVTVGNATQPFDRLLKAVDYAKDLLPRPLIVQGGPSKVEVVSSDVQAEILSQPEFQAALRAAEVVICHAGAGSILSSLAEGIKPIVFVRRSRLGEHVDDHQAEFAENMQASGRVDICEDGEDLCRVFSRASSAFKAADSTLSSRLVTEIEEIINSLM